MRKARLSSSFCILLCTFLSSLAVISCADILIPNFDTQVSELRTFTTPMKLFNQKEQDAMILQDRQSKAVLPGNVLLETGSTSTIHVENNLKQATVTTSEVSDTRVNEEVQSVLKSLEDIETRDHATTGEEVTELDALEDEDTTIFLQEKVVEDPQDQQAVGAAGGSLLPVDAAANPSYWLPGAWGSSPQPLPSSMYYTPSAVSTPDSPLYVTNPFYAPQMTLKSALPPITDQHNGATFDTNPATFNMEQSDHLKWDQYNSVSPLSSTVAGQPNANYVVPAWIEEASTARTTTSVMANSKESALNKLKVKVDEAAALVQSAIAEGKAKAHAKADVQKASSNISSKLSSVVNLKTTSDGMIRAGVAMKVHRTSRENISKRIFVPSVTQTFVNDDQESLQQTVYTDTKTGITYRTDVKKQIPVYKNFNQAQGANSIYLEAELKAPPNGDTDPYGTNDMSPVDKKNMIFLAQEKGKKKAPWAPSTNHTPQGVHGKLAHDIGNELTHSARGILRRNHMKSSTLPYKYPPDVMAGFLQVAESEKSVVEAEEQVSKKSGDAPMEKEESPLELLDTIRNNVGEK